MEPRDKLCKSCGGRGWVELIDLYDLAKTDPATYNQSI